MDLNGIDIRNRRKELGFTQEELGKKIGVSRNTIKNYENGGVIPESKREILVNFLFEAEPIKEEVVFLNNPDIAFVPLVSQYAYAGYLSGFGDDEYIETLPKIPIVADHKLRGEYLSFEVRGDSMEDGTQDSLVEGDILVCRIVSREYWKSKLHINKWDFVLVHRTEGILVKRIIDHNPETGDITIHSLNPYYKDMKLNLNDIAQVFNVVQVLRSRKR